MIEDSSIYVYGHRLPKLLQNFLEQGRWKAPSNTITLKQITGSLYPNDFTFLDVKGMWNESYPRHLIEDEELATIYRLASSKKLGKSITDSEILDIDKSVCIAINTSEETIVLDYRPSNSIPRVMAITCGQKHFTKWKIVAPTFDSFALQIGL